MNRFWYRAKDIRGKAVTGIMRAEHESQVYRAVREMDLFAVCIKEVPDRTRTRPLDAGTLAEFSKQISVMLQSGIPAVQAIHMLSRKEKDRKLAEIYQDVYRLLVQGYAMSEALKQQNGIFPAMMVNMVNAGEHGGHMADTMTELGIYYEKSYVLRKKIGSALVYPVFLLGMVGVGLVFLFTVVLPEFFVLFDSMESLPASTRFLMWASSHLVSHGLFVLAAVAAMAVCGICLMQNKMVRICIGSLLVHVPVAGPLMRTIYTARFARTMSALYDHGVPMVQAVGLTSEVMGNTYIERQLKEMMPGICEGISLSAGIMKVDGLDEGLAVNIFVGEETGELKALLTQAADRFEVEAGEAAHRLTALLEPVMIVLMGIVVGFIMLSVMMPLMQYYQSIG